MGYNQNSFTKKVVLTSTVTSWSLTLRAIFAPRKAEIEQKVIILFIENWKQIGPRFWTIWIALWIILFLQVIYLFGFWPSSGGKLESKLDQKCKIWVSPVSVKIHFFQNSFNGICTTMNTTRGQNFSSIWRFLLKLFPEKTPKWAQLGSE